MSHKKYRTDKTCLNCGAVVEKKFCPECGQENVEIHDSFFHMVGHFVADYLHYDTSFFTNLKLLLFKPGLLTKAYLEGKRMKYIHPLRLFFFLTIVMVISAGLYYKKFEDTVRDSTIVYTDSAGNKVDRATFEKEQELDEQQLGQIKKAIGDGFTFFSNNLKYISFFLLPVYALIIAGFYMRRKIHYVDHLIFVIHLLSFSYFILSILLLLATYVFPAFADNYSDVFFLIFLAYLIVALKNVYMQGWFKTILKGLLLTITMFVTSFLIAGTIVAIAIFYTNPDILNMGK